MRKWFVHKVVAVSVLMHVLGVSCDLAEAAPCAVAKNGLIPFLAITGRPTENAVRAKVADMHAQGIASFLIYARSGLGVEYMGEDWLQLTEWFCDEAERRGMAVWLYDEYNWPSGTCKGRVPAENDGWRYRELGVFPDGKGGYVWSEALAPAGWVNVCEPEAIRRFIELTHEVYFKRLRRWFDNGTIVGIFTDEPGHPTRVTFAAGEPLVSFRNWTGLADEYRGRTGRELKSDVEAWLGNPASSDVWPVYLELMGRRFRSAYFDQLRDWCDRHGILLTGHLIEESPIVGSCKFNGDPMLCIRGESLPGMDEIHTAYDPRAGLANRPVEWVTFNLVRQAVLHRGNGGLAELFACGPGDLTPSVLRQMVWLAAFHGVDRYIACMDVMDESGMVEKHGYFAPAGPVHPWYAAHARLLVDEARRAAAFARLSVSEREVAIRYPRHAASIAAFARHAETLDANETGPHPSLYALLKTLELNQFVCRLVSEDESSDLPLVFACCPDGTYAEERTGTRGLSADKALSLCRNLLPTSFRVLEEDGTPAGDLLVRTCSDGTSAVLNMRLGPDRTLVAERQGERRRFVVTRHGVRIFGSPEDPYEPLPRTARRRSLADARWTLHRDRPNICRVNFTTNNEGRVRLSAPLALKAITRDLALSYAVTKSGRPIGLNEQPPKGESVLRHEAVPYSFSVDGTSIDPGPVAVDLPSVYASLYRAAPAREFSAGQHAFKIVTGEPDRNYFLPALFLSGDFQVFDGTLVPEMTNAVCLGTLAQRGYPDYVGAMTWRTSATAPAGHALSVDTGRHVVSARFCGKDLGVRAFAPFEWAIPKDLQGKTGALELTIHTSAQPMFGDYGAPGVQWDTHLWNRLHAPDSACGLLAAEWIEVADSCSSAQPVVLHDRFVNPKEDEPLPPPDYFTPEALATADFSGLREESIALVRKAREELDAAEALAESLEGDDRCAVSNRVLIARRLVRYVSRRLADGRDEYLLMAWQGAKELEVMLDYFHQEKARVDERGKLGPERRLRAADFGVVADGGTDAGPFLRKALQAACQAADGTARVVLELPKGRIVVGFDEASFPEALTKRNFRPAHLWITNAVRLTVEGSGTTLVFGDATHLGVRAVDCRETVFAGFNVEFAENPSTQGVVVSVNEQPYSIDVAIDPGYPAPDSPRFLKAPSRRFTISDEHGFVQGTAVMGRVDRVPSKGEGVWRFTPDAIHAAKEYWHRPRVGDRLSVIARYDPMRYDGNAIDLRACRFCTLKGIAIHDSPGVNFRLFNTYATKLIDCRVEPREGDLVSSNADGCQVSGSIGPYMARCRFVGMEDDGINLNSPSYELEDVADDRMRVLGMAGEAAFVTRPADGKVKAVLRRGKGGRLTRPAPDGLVTSKGIRQPDASERNSRDYFGARAREYKRADRCVKIPSDLSGAVIVDTEFVNIRGMGIQVTAPNVRVDNVRCRHTTNGGINMTSLLAWNMHFAPHNVVVRDCQFEDHHNYPISVGIHVMAGMPASAARPIQDLLIENCRITHRAEDPLVLRNCLDVTVTNSCRRVSSSADSRCALINAR